MPVRRPSDGSSVQAWWRCLSMPSMMRHRHGARQAAAPLAPQQHVDCPAPNKITRERHQLPPPTTAINGRSISSSSSSERRTLPLRRSPGRHDRHVDGTTGCTTGCGPDRDEAPVPNREQPAS